METLKAAFPTTFVGRGIATEPDINLNLVKRVLEQNPNLDPREPLSDDLHWGDMSDHEQAKTKAALESLRHEIKMFPQFDYKRALGISGNDTPTSFSNPIRKGVARFFENEMDFEIAETHIDTYLAEHAETAFDGILNRIERQLRTTLKPFNGFPCQPRYEYMQKLMSEGLDSSYAISSMSQRAFIELYSGKLDGEMRAQTIHSSAKQITATNTNIYAGVYQSLNDVMPYVITGHSNELEEAIKKVPNWESLFGRIDLCDCEHCRSVYSPAAYFVDLLQFLNPKSGKKPLNVLLKRRPDLAHIKLTCENTNTPLPYADLVNEILEYYVVTRRAGRGCCQKH